MCLMRLSLNRLVWLNAGVQSFAGCFNWALWELSHISRLSSQVFCIVLSFEFIKAVLCKWLLIERALRNVEHYAGCECTENETWSMLAMLIYSLSYRVECWCSVAGIYLKALSSIIRWNVFAFWLRSWIFMALERQCCGGFCSLGIMTSLSCWFPLSPPCLLRASLRGKVHFQLFGGMRANLGLSTSLSLGKPLLIISLGCSPQES